MLPLHVLFQPVEGLHTEYLGLEFQDEKFQWQARKNEFETLNDFAGHQIHYYLQKQYFKVDKNALKKWLYYSSEERKKQKP